MIKFLNPVIVVIVFLTDRLTKMWILKNLYFSELKILPFFSFRYVENTGIAFGLFGGNNILFLITNTFFLLIIIYLRKKFKDLFSAIGIHFVIGGAIGNIYDRIAYKYVIDFFDFHFFPAVFNVADASITLGACLIGISIVLERTRGKKYGRPV